MADLYWSISKEEFDKIIKQAEETYDEMGCEEEGYTFELNFTKNDFTSKVDGSIIRNHGPVISDIGNKPSGYADIDIDFDNENILESIFSYVVKKINKIKALLETLKD